MASDPQECRQRAIICADRAATCISPSSSRKFTDLALVWLMLAVEFEEQVPSAQARTEAAMGAPKNVFEPPDLEIIDRVYEVAWAQIEARDPLRDRNLDNARRKDIMKRVLAAAQSGKFDFDILCERVTGSLQENWSNVLPVKPRRGGGTPLNG
jgi:hypothetical protein